MNAQGELGLEDNQLRGQLPDEMGDELPEVDLGDGLSAVRMTGGQNHSCALLSNGSVKCWGFGANGELGLVTLSALGDDAGEMGNDLPAVELGGGVTALDVAAGQNHSCALLSNGLVKCWGANTLGQLGLGDLNNRGDEAGEMGDDLPVVELGTDRKAVALSAGSFHTCVILDDGATKCWGYNAFGQLGQGDFIGRGSYSDSQSMQQLSVIDLGAGLTATNVFAGELHACALLSDGTLKCWGRNESGELGLGDNDYRGDGEGEMGDNLPAVNLGSIDEVVSFSGGRVFSCAIVDTGFFLGYQRVKCWGYGDNGELGQGDRVSRGDDANEMGDDLDLVALGSYTIGGFTYQHSPGAIATGRHHACVIFDDNNAPGSVKCWGGNSDGRLGLGDTVARGDGPGEMGDNLPEVDLGSGRTAVAIEAGSRHTCTVLDNGSVKCWGHNYRGQLGLGDTDERGDDAGEMGDDLPVVDLGSGQTAVAVSAGTTHTCAILDGGSVKCWGANSSGQLGLGDTDDRGDDPNEMGDNLPVVDLGSGRTAVAVSAGGNHTCALLDDGSVKCWGSNDFGQLGNDLAAYLGDGAGEMGDVLPTVMLGDGIDAEQISSAFSSTCALLVGGSVKCWGANSSGQLGQGDTLRRGRVGDMGDDLPAVRVLPEVAAV
ncbi:MAG: RCC1 domain-containing protein, partial [Ilumatobacteraceae bacterium]